MSSFVVRTNFKRFFKRGDESEITTSKVYNGTARIRTWKNGIISIDTTYDYDNYYTGQHTYSISAQKSGIDGVDTSVRARNEGSFSVEFYEFNGIYEYSWIIDRTVYSGGGEVIDEDIETEYPSPGSTGPEKATSPTPSNGYSEAILSLGATSWVGSGYADNFNVYYGVSSGNLSLVSSAQEGTSFGLSPYTPYNYNTPRYWRIDSTNDYGTTVGDEWSFSTIEYAPPLPSGITLVDTGEGGGGEGANGEGTQAGNPTGGNSIYTVRRLVAVANGRFWFEEL